MERRRSMGFSLVEVVIAVGICGLSVAAILGLVPSLARQSSAANDALIASQMPDALRSEFARLGFDSLAIDVPEMSSALASGYQLVASRDGRRLHSSTKPPSVSPIADEDQFFLIDCWKFDTEPLRFTSGKSFLAMYVRVSWPYRWAGGGPNPQITPAAEREQLTFTISVNR